jgi:alpha-L-fucosidase
MTYYEPTYDSVHQHPVPDWFHDAKLGIFVHWGLYSVPAWAPLAGELSEILESGNWAKWFANNPYAEWYLNSLRIHDSATHRHHVETYGPDHSYFDFAADFNAATEAWNPQEWADLFASVGARYVVLTTKHHDGFLLWPSQHPNPFIENYHARRDLVGELTEAVRARGMTMGLYYSGGLDWTFNDKVVQHVQDLPAGVPQGDDYVAYANNHWRELIDRYQTAVLWNDIAYPANTNVHQLFADYYNRFPEGVVNNRFTQRFKIKDGHIASNNHYDFETPEYKSFKEIRTQKWESCRGIGASFGYNQQEGPEHYLSEDDLIRSFVDIVSKNGNLLLNVGPMADGTIPALQRDRLRALGNWLAVNGEGIFGTRPWERMESSTSDRIGVRFTQKQGNLDATLLDTPAAAEITIQDLQIPGNAQIHLLGDSAALSWTQDGSHLTVTLPTTLPQSPAHTVRIAL